MGRLISILILRLYGWKYDAGVPIDKKFIAISAPHTSGWDFTWGKLFFATKRIQPIFFIKQEAFYFPMGFILRYFGARPIDRGKFAKGMVEQVIQYFDENETFAVAITPEGTREKTTKWKKGFYLIAQKANVPIYLGYLDYGNKKMGYGERFVPTGDIEKDMLYIKEYYKKLNPISKYPEKFSFDFS